MEPSVLAKLLPMGGTTKRLGTVTVPIWMGVNMFGKLWFIASLSSQNLYVSLRRRTYP